MYDIYAHTMNATFFSEKKNKIENGAM